jgi:hypothetical protein
MDLPSMVAKTVLGPKRGGYIDAWDSFPFFKFSTVKNKRA